MAQLFGQDLAGKLVTGTYKRQGRDAVKMAVEATPNVVMPDTRGRKLPYIFGTRVGTDDPNAGSAVLLRTDCFNPFETTVSAVDGFKPIEGLDTGEWFVTAPGVSDAFAFVERIQDPSLVEWAKSIGAKPLSDYVVGAAAPAAPARRGRTRRRAA